MVQLRPYQNQKIKEIYDAWQNHRSVMLQMPTGTGKTVLFNQIVKDELANNSKLLIIAHRKELIDQNVARLWNDFGIRAGTIMANVRADLSLPVQVASIQTLNRREYPDLKPSIVIIDEAHHVPAKSYRELWETYPDSKFLGVTATPIRLSNEGFRDLFDVLILSNSIDEFIQDGYLAKIKYIGRSPILPKMDLSNIAIIGGDYDSEQLSQKMCEETVMANLIQSYFDHAKGKKMIVFAVTTDHSKSIVERYQAAGFATAHIDADTKKEERNDIINKFRSGEIRILSNVGIVSEGFDVPDCEVVQLARPTKSLAMYLQQVGRCMRPSRSKPYSIVLDNVGLYDEFGSPKKHREWSLEASPKTRPDNDGDGDERLAREPLEEIDETLIVLEDVEMNTVDELKEKLAKINGEIQDLDDEISDAIDKNKSQSIIEILKTGKDQKETERDAIRRELDKALGLEQSERLERKLEEFQYYIDSFFEDADWETEEDKLTFMAQLKVSYDRSKEKSVATLCEITVPIPQPVPITTTQPVPITTTQPVPTIKPPRQPDQKLEVILHNKSINGTKQIDIFANTIKAIGIERVESLRLKTNKFDLIVDKKPPKEGYSTNNKWKQISENRWVFACLSGEDKKEILEDIAQQLGISGYIQVKLSR
ncbi:MAG: hypothetical protein DCF19_02765 [Pseudanabaena frigida]|uniref:Restriction endonuclease subunit R n=1 Tax=Pseudanabaena frigida TaxID=945775 RepID=A0A2W4YBE5_9CYAN|nr:MAG: hypothetical protein DCF19_02765 [Pseudanabaena frigida]